MTQYFKLFLFSITGGVLIACSTVKSIEDVDELDLPKKSDEELILALDSLSINKVEYFYAKASSKYKDSSTNASFKTTVRLIADSATNLRMTYANIPVVNALVSLDSVHVTNKREKCYLKESMAFLKESFAVDFSLKNIEELLLGLPIAYQDEVKYHQNKSDKTYTLCSHSKRDLRRIARGNLREVVFYYTLSEDLSQLTASEIISPVDSTVIKLDYLSRQLVDDILLPKKINVHITSPKKNINFAMEYKKIRVNQVESIHFVIPESYEKCK